MYRFFSFLILLGCVKPGVNLSDIRKQIAGPNCVERIKQTLTEHGCDELYYRSMGEYDIAFRCVKKDSERGEFWDNYIFRVSPQEIRYQPKDQKIVDKHTICTQNGVRVEAYPPEGPKK
tara:strand:+ start:306 stop:662 length:357 start_codon:yes stop_codon:yes gene_type:complete